MHGSRFTRGMALVVACGLTTTMVGASPLGVKDVAAPPSDVVSGLVRLPDPEALGVSSVTALMPVRWGAPDAGGNWSWFIGFVGGGDGAVRVLWVGRDPSVHVEVQRPEDEQGGHRLPRGVDEVIPSLAGGGRARGVEFSGLAGTKGDWTALLTREEGERPEDGFVLIDPGTAVRMYTHPATLARVAGRPFALKTELDGAELTELEAEVTGPDGIRTTVKGQRGLVAWTPDRAGDHAVRVTALGTTPDGSAVVLTTQHLIAVALPAEPLVVAGQQQRSGRVEIDLGPASVRGVLAAEVWGRAGGTEVPVCWVARLCDNRRGVSIDERWVTLAGVDPASLELRQVRWHDAHSYSLVEFAERIDLGPVDPGVAAVDQPTDDMLRGVPGASRVDSSVEAFTPRTILPGHRLMLVHGYCSDGNPFTVSQFSGDLAEFIDAGQNRSHDEFAQQMLAQGSAMKSFGVAAHSQGGMAALHLSTFYWSGLDWAKGERMIQTVGAPYQGTALAGNAAVLGDIFGSGCGSNADMTYDGSAVWLSLIPSWARANVWYWTTSFTDRPFAYDYCNFFTDLLLSDPNDGVIERSAGQLPGATNMGHAEGWCHTDDMRDPGQCTDATRNTQISQRARR